MATVKALTHTSPGVASVSTVPDLPVRDDYIKIQVHALALNPTDWKHIDYMNTAGARVGNDIAGTVVEVGAAVRTAVKVGDRVAGVTHGGNGSNLRDGGFAERAEIKDGLWVQIPPSMPWHEAATLGVGITTVGQSLYQSLQLPLPDEPAQSPFPVLIYGGATATGSLAVQFAHLSGLTVLTTASERHHEWLKSLGADRVYDYNAPNVGDTIRKDTNDELHFAFDTITNEQSMAICAAALASSSSEEHQNHYTSLLAPKGFPRSDCNSRFTMAYTATGEEYVKGGKKTEAKPQDWEYAKMFWKLTEKLLAQGKLKVHPVDKRTGGLEKVNEGLNDLKEGTVRGKKVVYVLE